VELLSQTVIYPYLTLPNLFGYTFNYDYN